MSVMRPSVRSCATTGLALIGASVIAVSALTPVTGDIRTADLRITAPAVQLVAAPNPIELYPQVVQRALTKVGALAQDCQAPASVSR